MTKEIVIAGYDKELSWMSRFHSDIKQTVYRKGEVMQLQSNEIKIEPNLGRCVHSFFYHIYHNYDNLSDYTFFAQDFPFDHWGNIIDVVNNTDYHVYSTLNIGGYFGFHNNTMGTMWAMNESVQHGNGRVLSCDSSGMPQDHNPNINVNKYWDILFDDEKPPNYEFIPGGHFGISKEHARLRSKEFYKKIIDLLVEDVTAPWMIERLECYIFNPKYKTKI